MNKIKCECGHINPEGTVLCEACGKPIEGNQHIDGNDKKLLLNMRYEGSARRSQTYRKSFVDKVWSFFSSVKVGVWLIVLALVASMIGTLFPQQQFIPPNAESRDPAVYYEAQFGMVGKIYYQLGFHEMYSSWWYLILLGLIGVSLVICSLDRFVPLYKALKIQKPRRHETFLNRQRFFSETEEVSKADIGQVKEKLRKQRYKVTEQNGHILAEKGRFSRWGPYVNHIGLIIILLAAILRSTPIMFTDEYVWVRDGETTVIPGTKGDYYVENKQFILDTHDPEDERFKDALEISGAVASNFQTDVVIYKATNNDVPGAKPELEPILTESIQMNKPAKFNGYTLYQSGYQPNEFSSMTFKIHETDDEDATAIDSFTINLFEPESEYILDNGFRAVIDQYYPDYYLDDDGIPASETNYPRNPAFVLAVYPPETSLPEVSFIGIGRNIDATGENEYKVAIQDFETHFVSGMTLRVDRTLIFFGLGAAIFMIGVIQGMYWQHRRVWIHPKNNGLLLAAHTNKNWFGLARDIEKAIEKTNIKMVEARQELDK
ncbi:cytochrome c biogenesis protein ResB [Oceanobacillus alkalisoli]|uniref:cytochrome c biogenesis protein ResB n=1 Tax=Oceanobacillus alkalisoli TaxID=2925113 RepID=UPI001EEF83D3|nr:cytochrome c biogenesis protein ResB [Oceanobacillus alkalisoli]MCF3942260.1 cytochrome c biogenesis protein ResB [Oceanobacillus alkalisoli]MCG5104496.1 cytochrome c biogenesis protein ResB [Oceanobacillus alkalisoli]